MVGSIDLSLENDVTRKETNSVLTGVFSDQDIAGWNYDIRLLPDASNASRYLTNAGGHANGLCDGFVQEDWQSGVIALLQYDELHVKKDHNISVWTPSYKTGSFSIFNDKRSLYSDYSAMQVVNGIKDGLIHELLRDDCKENTISCAVYKRHSDGSILAETVYSYADTFTGDLVDGVRLETEADGVFLTDNLSARFNEWVLRDHNLYLNAKQFLQVGIGDTIEDIKATWEYHATDAGQFIFLTYLNPIEIEVVVVNGDSFVMLSKLDGIDYITSTQSGYGLEADLGIIQVTGRSAEPIVIKNDLHELEETILCYYDDNFISLPERGCVQIGSEIIAYQSKSLNALEDCIRGYQGTVADSHAAGSIATFITQGTFVSGDYYVKYKAAPRVDYEVTTHDVRTANKTNWLNVHPFSNLKANKIIQIVSNTINLAEIILSTDEAVIGGNLYGPMYFGTDVANLTALALDASGLPVEDLEITLEKVYGPGTIDHSSDSIVEETNSAGEIYGVYNAPYDEASISLDVSDMSWDGDDTVITVPRLPTGVLPSDVSIYQIFKHDPSTGTVGKKVKAVAGGGAIAPWGLGYIDCRCVLTEDFNGGTLQVVYNGTRYTLNITSAMSHDVIGDEPLTRFYLEEYSSFLGSSPFVESTVWLYQPDAEVWNTSLKRGAQVIVYEWSDTYTHPKTKLVGAYGPVRATSISGTTVRYSNRHFPMAEPTNDDCNLGAYLIVCPAESRFRAYGRDPFSGNIVTSNEVRIKVIFPNALTGVDNSGVLPVPYGFTFITDEFNIGAGLGGSNFLTVNPNASGINQLTLRGQI